MVFKPISPKKISSQIAEQIRSLILAGEFSPGEKLPPERELAEMFGVSRPSVREALNMLAASGLVMSCQGGGTVVKSLVDIITGNPLSDLIKGEQERALDVIEVRKDIEHRLLCRTAGVARGYPYHGAARAAMKEHLTLAEQRSSAYVSQQQR